MREITDQAFDSLVNRVDYLANDFSNEDFNIDIYTPNCIFDPEADNGFIQVASYIETIAAKCIQNIYYAKRLFDKKYLQLSQSDFYNLGYFCYFQYRAETVYKPLSIAISNVVQNISLQRVGDLVDAAFNFSEWDIAEILFASDAKTSCWVIGQLRLENLLDKKLKAELLHKDVEGLVNTIIENGIDCSTIQGLCGLLKLKQHLALSTDEDFLKEQYSEYLRSIIEDPSIQPSAEQYGFVMNLLSGTENLSLDYIMAKVHTETLILVDLILALRHCCTDYDAMAEFNRLLNAMPEMRDSDVDLNRLVHGQIIRVIIPVLEDFRKKYVNETFLPESVGIRKNKYKAFGVDDSLSFNWTISDMYLLYESLVEVNLLSWDEETAFSFMYRMCPSYEPQRDDPSPIVWHGNTSELWTLVSHFHNNSFKKDKLIRDFFIKPDGSKYKSGEGGLHSSNVKRGSIPKILDNPRFKK